MSRLTPTVVVATEEAKAAGAIAVMVRAAATVVAVTEAAKAVVVRAAEMAAAEMVAVRAVEATVEAMVAGAMEAAKDFHLRLKLPKILTKAGLAENCAFSLVLGDLHNCGCWTFFVRAPEGASQRKIAFF